MNTLRIAIVGATGLVGRTFLQLLERTVLPITRLGLFATEKSEGQSLLFKGEMIRVNDLRKADFSEYDVAFFSAGKEASQKYIPLAVSKGTLVIDNGSFWRMHKDVPLVVPEVNFFSALKHKGIIANPNCSTIQLVVAINPIKTNFGLKKVEVSTYQAISGAGQKGIDKLLHELETLTTQPIISKHPIAFNIIFHRIPAQFEFSEEETKIINETKKILDLKNLKVSATCVRIPVLISHCESVSIETQKPFELKVIAEILDNSPGIKLIDDPANEEYPTPQLAKETDLVYVGRLRKNPTSKNGLLLWIVADNIRKGAASNAIQILETLWEKAPDLIRKFPKLFN
ncbi:MAG: aspartate-semialdehyde dehydrogenase [Candidatus Kapaibacteriales bacterium]